jgi:amidase
LLDKLSSYVGFTPVHNASGAPAISLPLGQDPDGLPIGVMFSGRRGSERTLLELALEIEEARPFSLLG